MFPFVIAQDTVSTVVEDLLISMICRKIVVMPPTYSELARLRDYRGERLLIGL